MNWWRAWLAVVVLLFTVLLPSSAGGSKKIECSRCKTGVWVKAHYSKGNCHDVEYPNWECDHVTFEPMTIDGKGGK